MTGPLFLLLPVTTIAFCWRLQRRDGVTLGFTTHDRDLVIAGLVYRAAPGMLPSAVTLIDGFDAGTMDVSGALTSAAISEADLASGRWDGARVRLFAADWAAPESEQLLLARGEFGAVSIEGAGFTAELRGPAALLDRPVVERTSPECRANFGDTRCRVDLAPRTRLTRVAAVIDEATIEVESASGEAGPYAYGSLRWISGANSGLAATILRASGPRLTLRDPVAFDVTIGDRAEIVDGCDKTFETCRNRFANSDNFRGEPHLPGNDLLTRYPGAN